MINEFEIQYIRDALEIAQSSVSEGGPTKPKVGAVVVKDGVKLERAHRGETKPGHHAEYDLLENKLHDHNLSGATLYTTLEPCTTRGISKVPCAQRIKDRKIARVVIGILDPNQDICGRGVRFLRDAGIEVDLFPVKYMAAVEEQNREFIRYQEQLSKLASEVSVIGLRLDDVEFEPSQAVGIHYTFKLRLYWTNVGEELHLGRPRWDAGGVAIQGHDLGYKYQLWTGSKWGDEVVEADVRSDRKVRIYIGLDPNMYNPEICGGLLERGTLGTLIIPVKPKNGRLVELCERPRKITRIPQQPKSSTL